MEEEKWRHDEQEEKQIKKEAPYSRLDGAIIAVSPRECRKHLASISQASRRIREREREEWERKHCCHINLQLSATTTTKKRKKTLKKLNMHVKESQKRNLQENWPNQVGNELAG